VSAPGAGAPRDLTGWRLLAAGALTALVLVPVTMPVAVLRGLVHDRFGVSELATSLFMSVNMIGGALSAPFSGALADRLRSRRTLVVGGLLLDAVLFLLLSLAPSFGSLLGLRALEGVAHFLALSSLLALLSESSERKGVVMGMAGAGITFGVALGAPLGGWIGREDPLRCFQAGAIILVVAAIAAALLLADPPTQRVRPSMAQIVELLRQNRALAAPLAFAFVDRFTTGFFTTTFSLYARRSLDLTPPQIGLQIALFMLPFSLLSYPVGRLTERRSRSALMAGGSLAYGVLTASLGWWPGPWLPVLMLGLGVTAAVMFVPSLVLTTDLADPRSRGTALGGFNAAGALGFLVGPLVGGAVSQAVANVASWEAGYRAAFCVAGLSELLCVALALPLLLRLRREGRIT
jgi:MFS family permease